MDARVTKASLKRRIEELEYLAAERRAAAEKVLEGRVKEYVDYNIKDLRACFNDRLAFDFLAAKESFQYILFGCEGLYDDAHEPFAEEGAGFYRSVNKFRFALATRFVAELEMEGFTTRLTSKVTGQEEVVIHKGPFVYRAAYDGSELATFTLTVSGVAEYLSK